MPTAPYRSAEGCAACGVPLVAGDALLSSRGPVCEACHKAESAAERERNVLRESNTSALLGGIFSTLAGVALLMMGVIATELPLRICVIAITVVVGAVARVRGMRTSAVHGTIGKRLVGLGAVLGAIGVVAIFVRFVS